MKHERILLVDDDPDVQLLYTAHLEAAGYLVRSACDGTSCLVAAKRDVPDLVILDLGLPAGDGQTALRNMRATAALAAVPVLVFSARESSEWEDYSLSLGASAYLQKPVLPQLLVAKVQELLAQRGQPAAPLGSRSAIPAPVTAPQPVGSLSCPHCGHALASLNAQLDAGALQALAQAHLPV